MTLKSEHLGYGIAALFLFLILKERWENSDPLGLKGTGRGL